MATIGALEDHQLFDQEVNAFTAKGLEDLGPSLTGCKCGEATWEDLSSSVFTIPMGGRTQIHISISLFSVAERELRSVNRLLSNGLKSFSLEKLTKMQEMTKLVEEERKPNRYRNKLCSNVMQ